jgi:hypothetical protein
MLCSSCNNRPGKRTHLDGAAGNRPLCSQCAVLRADRIQRNRLRYSLHFDGSEEQAERKVPSRSVTPIATSVSPTSEFAHGHWRDAFVSPSP